MAELFKDDHTYACMMALTDSMEIIIWDHEASKQVNFFKEFERAMACDDVMQKGNMAKYTQIPELITKLFSNG